MINQLRKLFCKNHAPLPAYIGMSKTRYRCDCCGYERYEKRGTNEEIAERIIDTVSKLAAK